MPVRARYSPLFIQEAPARGCRCIRPWTCTIEPYIPRSMRNVEIILDSFNPVQALVNHTFDRASPRLMKRWWTTTSFALIIIVSRYLARGRVSRSCFSPLFSLAINNSNNVFTMVSSIVKRWNGEMYVVEWVIFWFENFSKHILYTLVFRKVVNHFLLWRTIV